jgi:hypothetical protein
MITRYQKKISGPLMDRIDIHVDVPRVDFEKLTAARRGEPSAAIRERVEASRARQVERFEESGLYCNADMGPSEVRELCQLDDTGKRLMKSAMAQMSLSARAFHASSRLRVLLPTWRGRSRSSRRIWRRLCSTGRGRNKSKQRCSQPNAELGCICITLSGLCCLKLHNAQFFR